MKMRPAPDPTMGMIVTGGDDVVAHRSGPDAIWIDWFAIPRERRGRGDGRRLYEAFEASLPDEIKLIFAFAADTDGSGNSDGFWTAMGFEYRYDGEDLAYEAAHTMIKGINGAPTPDPIWIAEADQD